MTLMNSTQSPDFTTSEDTTIRVTDVFIFLITLCLAVFIMSANAMTVLAIWRTPALRTLANAYVCSLACADFVVGEVCVLLAVHMLPPLRVHWFDRSEHLCSLLNGLNIGMIAVSTFSMTLIAFDRYLYIIQPYFYQRNITIGVIGGSITLVWLAGLVVAFLPLFIATSYPTCNITNRLPVWYLFHLCTIVYLLTCAVNIVLYSVILRVACKQRKAVNATVERVQSYNPEQCKKYEGNYRTISKGTMKSIKFFLTVFGCFFICLTPMAIVLALDIYVSVPSALYRLLNVVALLNSAMNFMIYAAMNKQFRQAFLKTSALGRLLARCAYCGRSEGHGIDSSGDVSERRRQGKTGEMNNGRTREESRVSVVSYVDV